MLCKSLLLVTLASLIYQNDASDILKVLPQAQVILQKFLDIVAANQLNVSIVTSQGVHWSNGQLKQMRDSGLLLPPNNLQLTQSQLSQQVGKQWLSDLQSWTSQGKGIATYRLVSVENGKISEQLVESSNLDQVPITPSYLHVVEPVETGEDGLIEEEEDYEINYNFFINGSDGQEQLTRVFAVNLNITIIDNSEHMKLTQINQMKDIMAKIWLMFSDSFYRATYLAQTVNAQIPLSSGTWQVLVGPDSFFVPSGNWVQFNILDSTVVVFDPAS